MTTIWESEMKRTCCPVCGGRLVPWSWQIDLRGKRRGYGWDTSTEWRPWVDCCEPRDRDRLGWIDICENCDTVVS